MKKIFFTFWICLFFAINAQIFAQQTEYQSIFENATTFSYNLLWSFCDAQGTDSMYFEKDTTINYIEYKKFQSAYSENSRYLLRESEDHSKLYMLAENDTLIMDLNLNLRDTFDFFVSSWLQVRLVVDNIFYDDENLKHIVFEKIDEEITHCAMEDGYKPEFIEGIGPTLFPFRRFMILLCAHKDLENIFINNSESLDPYIRGKCFVPTTIGIEDLKKNKNNLKIYPNPAGNFIVVDWDENFTNFQEIVIYDLLGKPCIKTIVTQAKQHINIQNLPTGYYIMKTIGKDKFMYGKFSIMR